MFVVSKQELFCNIGFITVQLEQRNKRAVCMVHVEGCTDP